MEEEEEEEEEEPISLVGILVNVSGTSFAKYEWLTELIQQVSGQENGAHLLSSQNAIATRKVLKPKNLSSKKL